MKVSIITATYNSEKTISDTLESVLNQTYTDIEYIIIDGASKDGTLDIVRQYKPRFEGRMRIVSEPDKGIYDALNKGINYATGDVIGFIHADDTFAHCDILTLVAEQFETQHCDLLYGDLYYVDPTDTKVIRNWKSCKFEKKLLQQGWMPAHPTLYVRRQVYDRVGGFDTSYKISADYDFILRTFTTIETEKIVYLPKVMVRMRVGGVSNNGLKNIARKIREDLRTLRTNKVGGICTLIVKNTSKIKQLFVKNRNK